MKSAQLLLHAILLVLVCGGWMSAAQAETSVAYVHFGAILLGEAPATNHNARRPRVGYLPIGTVVKFDAGAEKVRIFNHSEVVQAYENYLFIQSDIGVSGYIRDDLITPLGEQDILLPLRYNINIRALDSDEVVAQITRAADKDSSTPVEVLGEDADYYHVRLHQATAFGNAYLDGRISKPLVDGNIVVRLSNDDGNPLPDIQVSSPTRFVEQHLTEFSEFVSDKAGETAEQIFSFLEQLNALQCRVSSSADAALSAKIFGTGLGLEISFVLAEQNAVYSIKSLKYSRDGLDYTNFYELHDVRCVDGIPHRLNNLILINAGDPSEQIIVSKEDLPAALKDNWVRFETDKSRKMIIIDGFTAYEQFMNHINQSEYLRSLPPRERSILSHAILKELAYFSTPE